MRTELTSIFMVALEIQLRKYSNLTSSQRKQQTLLAPRRWRHFASRNRTSATQRQKFHTNDVNQCLHNKSGSHGVSNATLFNYTFLLVDFGKVLCSPANKLQQNSNASSREEYIPEILSVLLSSRLHLTFVAFCLLSVVRKQ